MLEVDWTGPIAALGIGLVAGIVLAVMRRDGGDDPTTDARLEDLRREKDRILQALRDLQDSRTGEATEEERGALEARAAEILRLLEEGAPKTSGKRGGKPKGAAKAKAGPKGASGDASAPVPTPAPVPAPAGMSGELKGALKGGGVVAFAALLAIVLMNGTSERQEGMSITGTIPEARTVESEITVPSAGQTGGSVAGVPSNLQPQPSPAVDLARAKVASDPATIEHWAELGYALVDAEGWIDAWNVSDEIEKRVPGHPDGRVIGAMVRLAMGQADAALELLNEALSKEPDHLMGLTYRGMVAGQMGDLEGAKRDWTRARDLTPSPEDKAAFDELLARAESGELLTNDRPGPSDPHAEAPAATPSDAGAAGAAIQGTIALAPGTVAPPGAVIFVIARAKGVTGGPPAATKRMFPGSFPAPFSLGAENVMMGGPFPDEVDLSVRLDLDGNAMTKSDADLNGSAGVVAAGTTGVVIELK